MIGVSKRLDSIKITANIYIVMLNIINIIIINNLSLITQLLLIIVINITKQACY